MNRRGFFKSLGLGAGAIAVAPLLVEKAAAFPEPVFCGPNLEGIPVHQWHPRVTGSAGAHTHTITTATVSNMPSNTHSICTCHSPHNHGCPAHRTGVFACG